MKKQYKVKAPKTHKNSDGDVHYFLFGGVPWPVEGLGGDLFVKNGKLYCEVEDPGDADEKLALHGWEASAN